MSRVKSILAVLVLAAIVCIAPQAFAAAPLLKVSIAGSSAMWQTMALGAYNSGHSIALPAGKATCHWTDKTKFTLTDVRPGVAVTGTPNVVDTGDIWIVWDYTTGSGISCTNAVPVNYWVYLKVDSVVGDRCFFAAPACQIQAVDLTFAAGNKISLAPQNLWGDGSQDTALPAVLSALFTAPKFVAVGTAATDIRPEDANFAACRVNSPLGNGGWGAASDNLDGLGYIQAGATQTAGDCFPFTTKAQGIINGVGTPIYSGYGNANVANAGDAANVASFALSGVDPITGQAVPKYSVINVGAAPMVWVKNQIAGTLTALHTASERQLELAFSGTKCTADVFNTGLPGAPVFPAVGINIFLREPLSGTYNTTEATVMRYPTVYPLPVEGLSQETGVGNPAVIGTGSNPLNHLNGCGNRYRGIGTGEVVKGVLNSNAGAGAVNQDGIGYAFFSYGNVGSIAGSANYGYIKVNGVDPIFATYDVDPANIVDPGQQSGPAVASGVLPLNTPCGVGPAAFPCPESTIWKAGLSFPNVRNGSYRAWSILRLVPGTVQKANAQALATASNTYVVTTVPDYVPVPPVKNAAKVTIDPGFFWIRSHYQQKDGSNPPTLLGSACKNFTIGAAPEAGGDVGGMEIQITGIIPVTLAVNITSEMAQCQMTQSGGNDNDLSPQLRQ